MPSSSCVSYRDLLDDATNTLFDGSETPRIDAEILMQYVIDKPLAWLIAHGESAATNKHIKVFYDLIKQRHAGQPIAYLTGRKDFWSLSLKVNNHVLIPRPDTETLVEQALERLTIEAALDVLDLGTGSGAIALSIAKERPKATVLAVDSQEDALAVAKENAIINQVHNTQFLQSDWYSTLSNGQRFDLIAANPPYIESADPHLQKGDLRFEPITALVANNYGFADLELIINQARLYLKTHGWLLVEHGYTQADKVTQLFKDNGFDNVDTHHDINDLPRCTSGQQP